LQNELISEITRALEDEVLGIVAQLIVMPAYEGDVVPTDVKVINGTLNDNAVQGEQLPESKADLMAIVTPDGPTIYEDANIKGLGALGKTPVAITVSHRGSQQPAAKVRAVGYVARAIRLAVQRWFEQDGKLRDVNGISILRFTGLSEGLIQHDGIGGLAAVVFTIQALDKRAQRKV
jgi:hypothetical protein